MKNMTKINMWQKEITPRPKKMIQTLSTPTFTTSEPVRENVGRPTRELGSSMRRLKRATLIKRAAFSGCRMVS